MRKLNLEDLFSAYRLVGTLGYKNILEETTAAFKRFEKEISYQKKSGKHNINAEALKRQAGIVVIAKVMDIIAKDRVRSKMLGFKLVALSTLALVVLAIFANMLMSESAKEYYMGINGQNEIIITLTIAFITFLCMMLVEKL